jgi:hypothetical protein
MSSKYFKYRIKCTTDDKYEYWILNENYPAPIICPTNTTHTVDTTSTTIVQTISENIVKVKEETVDTGGNYMTECIIIAGNTGPNVTTTRDFIYPFPISVLGIQFVTEENQRGDEVSLSVGPNTIVGYLTADAPTGATGLDVSQTVVDNSMIGYHINLFTPPSTIEELGRIIALDKINKKIYCENTPSSNFSAAGPTYIQQTAYTIINFTIGTPGRYPIGDSKIGGSYVPANTIIRSQYINKGTTQKNLTSVIEYLY